jgi:AsmA protein
MKFNIKWVLAVGVAVLVALAAAPWTVSQDAQILTVERQIRSTSGLRLASHGRSVFALLPRPHIRIYDAELDHSGGVQISASSLRFDLGLAGLLTGRLALARTALFDAVITIDAARAESAAPAAGEKIAQHGVALGEVEIANGKVFLRWQDSEKQSEKPMLVADDVDARLDWDSAGKPLSLTGHCRFPSLEGDQPPAQFALWAAQPDQLPGGGESPITLRVDGDSFQLDLNGAMTLAPHPRFHGQIASAAPSLRLAALWLGVALPLPGPYANASIKGEASLDPTLLAFPAISITLDGNSLDGAASIRLDGTRPLIAATLAGKSVNLAPMFRDLPAATAGGQWSHEVFPSSALSGADLDLRLSAAHARLGDFQFDDAALSAILKNGRLELSLAEASAYSGQVRARAIIAETSGGLDVRGTAFAQKVDVAALLWDGMKRQSLSGTGHADVSFESSGASFYELASHLDARGEIGVEQGEIFGLDLGLAFRRMERRPLSAGQELRSGRTAFDTLEAKFSMVQGQADIEEGVARAPRMTVYFSGRAQLAERTVDLHAMASRAAAGDDAKPLQLGFTLTGGWDDAILAPDALSLINRSDAAAPLLPKPSAPN